MPTYVYRCDTCDHQFELFQRMADDPIDTCPECQAKVRRVIHPVGVVFKGSGWYINDSRSKNTSDKPAVSTSEASNDAAGDKKEAKSDKVASKPEPAKTAAD